jgi:hypothetical protein
MGTPHPGMKRTVFRFGYPLLPANFYGFWIWYP